MTGDARTARGAREVTGTGNGREFPLAGSFRPPVETKLRAPAARKEWVERTELVGHLAATTVRLLLVDAPTGFGKTTVVAQWRSSPAESRPFAWISLDPGDNDPGRLWLHIVCALQLACSEFSAAELLAAVRAQVPDLAGTVLPLLVNELAALPEPVVVVLDDYHVIKDRSCHDQVGFLLAHLPPAVQLVLVTRADPPLPIARLRAAGELVEIRARELRFAPAEAAVLVTAVAGVELGEIDLADLVDRTEGWPAGLYLAAMSLRGHPAPSAFIRDFTGNSRFVVDFLAEEVLSRQPAGIRQFLILTSVLGRFCAPLCDAVTGSADSAEIIGILERENLFVVALDDTRQWFRYHHLFAQVLRSELARTEPGIVPVLHQRASTWHRQSDSADEAISYASAAGDVAQVIDLLATHWYAFVDSGRAGTVRGWLSSLGDGIVSTRPVAAHCAAWTAALSGDRESLRRWLPVVEAAADDDDGPLPDGVRSMQSSATLLKGTFGFEGIGPMREAAARAVTLETDPATPWYALALVAYARALYWSGDPAAAAAQAQGALASRSSLGITRMLAFEILSLIEVDEGDLDQAEQLAQSARECAGDAVPGLGGVAQSSLAYTAVGAVLARQERLTDARRELEHALRLRRSHDGISPWPTVEILLRLAPVRLNSGDRPGAIAVLAEARQLLTSSPDGADAQLARLGQVERRITGQLRGRSFGEPLTDREAAVLRLLRGTLSLREIGQELYLSPNTIKTHAQAIYRKLGVTSRPDAIARAQDAGLLEHRRRQLHEVTPRHTPRDG